MIASMKCLERFASRAEVVSGVLRQMGSEKRMLLGGIKIDVRDDMRSVMSDESRPCLAAEFGNSWKKRSLVRIAWTR